MISILYTFFWGVFFGTQILLIKCFHPEIFTFFKSWRDIHPICNIFAKKKNPNKQKQTNMKNSVYDSWIILQPGCVLGLLLHYFDIVILLNNLHVSRKVANVCCVWTSLLIFNNLSTKASKNCNLFSANMLLFNCMDSFS